MRDGDLHRKPHRSSGSYAPLLDSPPPRRCPPAHLSLRSSAAYFTVVLATGGCPSRTLRYHHQVLQDCLAPVAFGFSEVVPDKSTVAVKLALRRKKPLSLSVSLSLTPHSWKEKLLKTPPGGDVPSWNVGSIILIERRPLAFLSTKAWTGPSRHYTVSSLHCRRRGTHCMTPPGRIVSTFSIIVRSSDHSYAGSASI